MPIICGKRVTRWRHICDGVLRCTANFDLLNEKTGDIISRLPGESMEREHSLMRGTRKSGFLRRHRRRPLMVGGRAGRNSQGDKAFLGARLRRGVIDGNWHAGGRVPISWSKAMIKDSIALCCSGKVVDTIDGVGAISKVDLENNVMTIPDGHIFPTVQQPRSPAAAPDWRDPKLHEVLVGGCDINGSEMQASAKCLYKAFPVNEPSKDSSYYRNWLFLNSSADLLIKGRPLSSYFTLFSEAPQAEPSTTSGLDNPSSLRPADPATLTLLSAPVERKKESAAARQAMEVRTKMRRLIVTESSGLLGIAPAETQPGDVVIVVAGHGKPLIARKVKTVDDQDFWHLMGEAYIDGMMNSEKLPISRKTWNYAETQAVQLDLIVFV
ncbi:hypothetical protein HD806DRAFT_226823 [Xylariaceae sp. AK1471]|nr:hypothetical protein HD806DRAFT_226823 [Xylariaceae sp. AK1471]